MPRTFTCRLITPDGEVFRRDAVSVRFPALDGQVGVLADHAPMISLVGTGGMTVSTGPDDGLFVEVAGGFAEVRNNVLTILAERTGRVLERTAEGANRELDRARRQLHGTDR